MENQLGTVRSANKLATVLPKHKSRAVVADDGDEKHGGTEHNGDWKAPHWWCCLKEHNGDWKAPRWWCCLKSRYVQASVGICYLVLTLIGSWRFLTTSAVSLSNDFFWTEYNATGGGVYITNAYNLMLQAPANASVSKSLRLDDPTFLLDQQSSALVRFSMSSARMVQYHRLRSITDGILGLRRVIGRHAGIVFTQYCWVDFQKRWSLAHTAERASRCLREEKYKRNGAMYLETLLRNVDRDGFMSRWATEFNASIEQPIRQLPGGNDFFNQLAAHMLLSIEEEEVYWRQHGIEFYELQFTNRDQIGIVDKIRIVNALGMESYWTTKQLEYVDRFGICSTFKFYWSFHNDLWAVGAGNTNIAGRSLVREAPTFYEKDPTTPLTLEQVMMEDGVVAFPLSTQDALLREAVGPFGSIDTFWIMYPPELFDLVVSVSATLNSKVLEIQEATEAYMSIRPDFSFDVSPMTWFYDPSRNDSATNWSFVGGNPFCGQMPKVSYVQRQLAFDDTCTLVVQESSIISRPSLLFAILASISPDSPISEADAIKICKTGVPQVDSCQTLLMQAKAFASEFLSFEERRAIYERAQLVRSQIARMNISVMQFATRPKLHDQEREEATLLVEPILHEEDDQEKQGWHPLFGWLSLYDWARGYREVISFEGDHGTLLLISADDRGATFPPNPAEISYSMSLYFQRGVQYVTLVFLGIAAAALFYAIANTGNVAGLNFLDFNRVCGTVWVGRPLLLLRGIVAICILSTGRPVLTSKFNDTDSANQLLHMEEHSDSIINTVINAGEATWIVYVVNDIIMVFTHGLTYQYALAGSTVVWISAAILQVAVPIQHTATLDPKCEYIMPDEQVTCESGTIYIGRLERLLIILLIILVALLVCYVVVRLLCKHRPMRTGCALLLPGIAQEVFSSDGWMHQNEWFLDPASAIIAGLVTIRCGGISRVLDVKSWTLFRLRNGEINLTAEPEQANGMNGTQQRKSNQSELYERDASDRPAHLKYAIRLSTKQL